MNQNATKLKSMLSKLMRTKLYLHLVADVDNEGVRDRVEGDPSAVAMDLEAGDLVLEEESDEVGVSVGGQAICELWLWTCWIIMTQNS